MSGAPFFWLAPALPLAAAALLVLGFGRAPRLAPWLAVAALAGSTVVAATALFAAAGGARAVVALPWLAVGGRRLELALGLDPLSALAAALVAVVALLVFIYAARYMRDDPGVSRFFTIFSLFAGAMLALVLAADLLTLFIAWELVGVCSYLLIGFWFERPGVPAAATKAFLTTRIADQALLAGVLLLVGAAGGARIERVLASAGQLPPGLLLAVALLIFAGAAGKSAQAPFSGWLPDAMVGPTPVSALLHSATMVAAGVFLVARLYPLFLAAPAALAVVAWVGAITALLGATAALVQTDLKRTLAYSTMSQLGLMFVGLGSGSLVAGVLLLVAQALYKAPLFLAAGAVDHAVHGTTYDRMGGLWRRMPLTAIVFGVAAAALAGLPVTLALPAKDPVLAAALARSPLLFAAALLASVFTALYSARAFSLVFLGRPNLPQTETMHEAPAAPPQRAAERSALPDARVRRASLRPPVALRSDARPEPGAPIGAREAPAGFLGPLLGFLALIFGGLLADAPVMGRPLARLLGAEAPEAAAATTLALVVAAVGVIVGLWARRVWPRALIWPPLAGVAPLLAGEYGLRPLYSAVARSGLAAAGALGAFDRRVFDPLADAAARVTRGLVWRLGGIDRRVFDAFAGWLAAWTLQVVRASGRFDLRRLDAAFNAFGQAILTASQRLRRLQTGHIENYLLLAFVWGLGVLALAVVITLR